MSACISRGGHDNWLDVKGGRTFPAVTSSKLATAAVAFSMVDIAVSI